MRPALVLLLAVLFAPAGYARERQAGTAGAPDRSTLLQRAEEARKAGRVADAVRLFLLAGERHESVRGYVEAARMQSAAGNTKAALDSLAKARTLAPNSEDVLSAYAQLSLATRQPLQAVLTLQALARMLPQVAEYRYLLGVGLISVGDMPSAADALAEANRLEPDRALTLLAMGLVHNNRKLFADAKGALSRSLELQPDSIEALAALAEAEAGLGNVEGAVAHAEKALERSPANATANLVLGMILMERGNHPQARDRLLKAADADPDSAKAVYQLSLVFARMGDDASAGKYLEIYREKMRAFEEKLQILRAGG